MYRTIKMTPKPIETNSSEDNKAQKINFNDMQLKVNDKLQIRLVTTAKTTDNKTSSITVILIGYIYSKTLLTSSPKLPLVEGDKIMLRYFSGKNIFSFYSFVDKNIYQPFKYMHLSFPQQISSQVVRKSKRIESNIKAKINNDSQAIITNISSTGAKIESDADFGEVSSSIKLSFVVNIYGKQAKLEIQAIIKTVNFINKNNQTILCYGIEFAQPDSEQLFILNSLVHKELAKESRNII